VSSPEEKASPAQLFIVEFDLADLSGHFFNQILGFKLAAEEAGLKCTTLLPRNVDASLADSLGGKRVIDLDLIHECRFDFKLDIFAEGHRLLQSLWETIDEAKASRDDILLITSARPIVIYSLGVWLGQRPEVLRPAVYIRFFDHAYVDAETMDYTELSWTYRFASKDLSLRPGQERVFFTTNNKRMLTALGGLCERRVFQMPIPKYYGELIEIPARAKHLVIYVHLNMRSGVLLRRIESIIRRILDRCPQVTFLVKYCLNALKPNTTAILSRELVKRGVELIPSEQSHTDYLNTIARSDIVLLPYEVTEYKALASGVFAEAAALGKIIVYPNHTWMSEQVSEGHATGYGFDTPKRSAICTVLLRALEQLPQLAMVAKRQSANFREENSCRRNLDLMRALACEKQDMRPAYAIGTTIDFRKAAHSRFYMEGGWSDTETTGVWTDGPKAELRILCEKRPIAGLRGRIFLTPFLVKGLSRQLDVFVNETRLSTWNFPARQHYPVGLDIDIPAELVAAGEINICFKINNPISPKSFGVSNDPRRLGVMLHDMCFTDEACSVKTDSVK
jgi:glycosyltransferase involved in cell wall biosynthesis